MRARKLSSEFRLAAACCIWPKEKGAEKLSELLEDAGIDWERFLRVVERHRIAGFVHNALKDRTEQVPGHVRKSLGERGGALARTNLLLARTSIQLAKQMGAAGVRAAFLKGIPLAMVAFGGLTLRHSRDIDLLVAPGMVDAAAAVMVNAGYRQIHMEDSPRPDKHREFVHERSGILVELHSRLFDNSRLLETFGEESWVEVGVGGSSLLTLRREELMLYLCAHGAVHGWFRLKWLADVEALCSEATEQERRQFIRYAEGFGLARPVLQALDLCAVLFGAPMVAEEERSWRREWLVKVALDAMTNGESTTDSQEPAFGTTKITLSQYLLKDDFRYLGKETWIAMVSKDDARSLALPGRLRYLYPLLRVPLWMARNLRKLAS